MHWSRTLPPSLTERWTTRCHVTNQNEAPTDITVAGGTVRRTRGRNGGRHAGRHDPDAGSTFTYTLRTDPSGKFEVVGDEIRVKAGASLDYESAASHQVR